MQILLSCDLIFFVYVFAKKNFECVEEKEEN